MCVFPEAGISWSYAVRSLMRGPAALARETGAPLVPVALWGTQRIWSVGRPVDGRKPRPSLRRHRPVDVAFGEPLTVPPGEDLVTATTRLGHALTDLVEGLQRHPDHVPAPGEHAPWYPAHLGGHAPDRAEALALDDVPRSAVPPSLGSAHADRVSGQTGVGAPPVQHVRLVGRQVGPDRHQVRARAHAGCRGAPCRPPSTASAATTSADAPATPVTTKGRTRPMAPATVNASASRKRTAGSLMVQCMRRSYAAAVWGDAASTIPA